MTNLDDENTIDEGEMLDEEEGSVRRRKKVVLTGIFIENDADVSLDKLSNTKSGRF